MLRCLWNTIGAAITGIGMVALGLLVACLVAAGIGAIIGAAATAGPGVALAVPVFMGCLYYAGIVLAGVAIITLLAAIAMCF